MAYGPLFGAARPAGGFMTVNVGGFRHRMEQEVVQRFPQTRLGRLLRCRSTEAVLELCDDFSPSEMEFYFDRNPGFFLCYVLTFYVSGELHLVEGLCVVSFCQELEYWGLREAQLAFCCSTRFHQLMASAEDQESQENCPPGEQSAHAFGASCCADVRRNIWVQLEEPGSSAAAKAAAVVSLGVVIGSIVSMCVHSMEVGESASLRRFDSFCTLFFSAEFLLRLAVAPSARRFLRTTLNLIDFMTLVPFYVTAACDLRDGGESGELEDVGRAVQILRLMRVLRVLKLARHSAGLRSLGATLQHSVREVGQLLLFLSVGVFFFSTLVYFAERECEESGLQTIPTGWWWATISMTTVGYGDTVPATLPGKLVGTLCILCGLLIVALPITSIFNKFSKFYQRQKEVELRGRSKAPSAART